LTAKESGSGPAAAARRPFGTLPDGQAVEAVTLARPDGIAATILTYGATLQALLAPDRDGALADVVLGHATLAPYLDQPQFLGSTVGRVANRIAGGRFRLNGQSYQIAPNNGPNALHGGAGGFDKVNWDIVELVDGPVPSVTLALLSPDGDQGFPGELRASATYALTDATTLSVTYRAETDRPTIVNLSNHAYWNLAGEGSPEGALGHRLQILADHFLPTDATSIPTGEIRPVDGTPFDFRRAMPIGARVRDAADDQIRIGRGYDHNMVLSREATAEPRLVARLWHDGSGRMMELLTDQPGLQFYSGNFLDGTSVGKSGCLYRMGDAVALEPQMPPDTPNRPAFGSLRLAPGEVYRNRIAFRFSVAGPD
jgi:aldose 1-epimerase